MRCPAHDDRTASLCIRAGDKGIVMHCKAGCTVDSICASLGIRPADLFYERARGSGPRAAAPAARSAPAAHSASPRSPREYATIEAAFGRIGRIERVYDYTDAAGQLLFMVVRLMTPEGKTFRQCRPAHAGQREPVLMGVRDEDKHTLYRLPEVAAALRDGKPVLVVEGEKDADNLAALGYAATTCSMGAGKWHSACSAQLTGALVYVLGDNDEPGRKHAEEVARSLLGVARDVRVADVASVCPDLKPKGDISDVLADIPPGDRAAVVASLLSGAPPFVLDEGERYAQVQGIYASVPGYGVRDGCIVQITPDSPEGRPLATFVACPGTVVTRDDGVTREKSFLIDGWSRGGSPLPTIEVPAARFAGMGWVTEYWDFAANIMPGSTARDKVRYLIAEVGARTARHATVYTHTGWRRINGRWAYLYQGGAIGAGDITVELTGVLDRYTLDTPDARPPSEALMDQFVVRGTLPEHIYVPLTAAVFLAPLREFLSQAGCPPGFSLFLLGRTGTRKSTVAALALSYFGLFDNKSLPASFNDSANAIRKKGFLLKDTLLVVDDYHPETNPQERRRMEGIAQALSRAFGDGADRGRMRADLGLQDSMPPRCLALVTGEDLPNISEGGVARYYQVQIASGDIQPDESLTEVQRMARAGTMRNIMRGYLTWLAGQTDELAGQLSQRFYDLRSRAARESRGAHGRAPESVAHLALGYGMLLDYMVACGVLERDTADIDMEYAWRTLMSASNSQSAAASEERPTSQYIRALAELLQSRTVRVVDIANPEPQATRDMVGYCDSQYYYFLSGVTYRAVCRLYQDQGQSFPVSERMLCRMMKEEGSILPDSSGAPLRVKRIGDTVARYLTLPRALIDGDDGVRQMNFADVTAEQAESLPFDDGR